MKSFGSNCASSATCIPSISTTIHLRLDEWAAKYGPTYRLGRAPVVMTGDSAFLDEVLRARPETLRRGADANVMLAELGVDDVFQRLALSRVFSFSAS
jgi:hypothetical protein